MGDSTNVERDVAMMAEWWGRRKVGWLDRAAREFGELVDPYAYYAVNPALDEIMLANMCFTEWFLFESLLQDGKTPLGRYIDRHPDGASDRAIERLRQVEVTQFFSRFEIKGKDAASGICDLRDVRTDTCYEVLDRRLCKRRRWCKGTIAERIGCVDDQWQLVGQVHLYDRALPQDTAVDGPGEVHPEDIGDGFDTARMSYYLRLLRDTIGMGGRYVSTVQAVSLGAS